MKNKIYLKDSQFSTCWDGVNFFLNATRYYNFYKGQEIVLCSSDFKSEINAVVELVVLNHPHVKDGYCIVCFKERSRAFETSKGWSSLTISASK